MAGVEVWEVGMYEKDEDEGNVGFQFKMAREVFKPIVINHPTESVRKTASRYTNPILSSLTAIRVDEGAKEFESHEDVMAKLVGKEIKNGN